MTENEGYYWFAVRETWKKTRTLKVLSRRMRTEQEAIHWAEFEESQAKRKNPDHRYVAIYMKDE